VRGKLGIVWGVSDGSTVHKLSAVGLRETVRGTLIKSLKMLCRHSALRTPEEGLLPCIKRAAQKPMTDQIDVPLFTLGT
jgi:hypothetical protein